MDQTEEACDIDLYAARMLCAKFLLGDHEEIGSMEAFTRKLPNHRSFLVNVGLHRIAKYIKNLKITGDTVDIFAELLPEIDFLREKKLVAYLLNINFAELITVEAMNEGEIVFENEPVIRITGPIGVIQYMEKKILSILNHDIRIASKAARITIAAQDRPVSEFGGRRGSDKMSAEAARAAYIAGFSSTSNVLAYKRYGIPCYGTMGHVFIQSYVKNPLISNHDPEFDAYKDWGNLFKKSIYLPDTYHLLNGVNKVIDAHKGNIGSIRLDVDNLKDASINVKRILNQRDCYDVQIGATNDLNEYKIKELLDYGCPIDWFGVGTEVVSTPDAPTCNFVFKLVSVGDINVCKISEGGKATLPGPKQIYRCLDSNGEYASDLISLKGEKFPLRSLIHKINIDTCADGMLNPAGDIRMYFLDCLNRLMPMYLKTLDCNSKYPVNSTQSLLNEIRDFKNLHNK